MVIWTPLLECREGPGRGRVSSSRVPSSRRQPDPTTIGTHRRRLESTRRGFRMTAQALTSSTPGRRLRQLAWRVDEPLGLALMFAVALVLRLLLAPHLGFYGDLRLYRIWAERLDDVGLRDFYTPGQFVDYPPG